jgi:hypothetical protein
LRRHLVRQQLKLRVGSQAAAVERAQELGMLSQATLARGQIRR